ncbi:MAG: ABC transporter permease [Pirellulales bacterium]|nr:ABC transporter permease [Pirellulales bacterium]
MELIRLEDIRKTYFLGEVDVPALCGVSFTINRGEMVALMGASGSGKTTLMNILGCLDHPTSGKFWLDGEEMSGLSSNQRAIVRSEKIGFVFQNFNLLSRTTALGNVVMPLDYAVHRHTAAESYRLAGELLERVGLTDRIGHEPSQMSGGQQQRVAIARSLINRPKLLLADEPTGNLDSHTSVEILKMFQRLNTEGITVLLVTHDPNVANYAHRTIRIADGLVEGDEYRRAAGETQPPAPHISLNGDGNGDGDGGNRFVRAERRSATVACAGCATASGSSVTECKAATIGRANLEPSTTIAADAPCETVSGVASAPAQTTVKAPRSVLPATWRTALGALKRNKMRSTLSALGVIIAVAAVIAMTEIGQGSKATLQKSLSSLGANTLMVRSGAASTGGVTRGSGSVMTLTPEDAEAILKECPAVAGAAPTVNARSQIVYGKRNWVPSRISGTTPSYLQIRDWGELSEGIMFTDRDVRSGTKVCVVGATVKKELFGDESPVGKEIRINNVPFRVLGVLAKKGASMMMDQDDVVLAPWTTIKYRVSGSALTDTNQSASAESSSSSSSSSVNSISDMYTTATSMYLTRTATEEANTPQLVRFVNVDMIHVKAKSAELVPAAIEQITALLHERHRIRDGEADDFNIRDMAEISNMLNSTSETMSTLLLVVALISLVVGGVGIMNIMLVSVTERTREIGLRMAVGARGHHILRQFLVEAVVLCLLGGTIGILAGRGVSLLVRSLMHWPTEISLPAIAAAVAVSVGVGMVFGFYPAWKASRLDPIEALRYE